MSKKLCPYKIYPIMLNIGTLILGIGIESLVISNAKPLFLYILIPFLTLLIMVVITMCFAKFIVISAEKIIIYDYRKFFLLKKVEIDVSANELKKVEIDYVVQINDIKFYYTPNGKKEIIVYSFGYSNEILKELAKYKPKAHYVAKISGVDFDFPFGNLPKSDEMYLKELKAKIVHD